MHSLLLGVMYGLILMIFTGPAFFYMISIGISKGFRAAAFFALGIFLSDLTIICCVFFGLKDLFENGIFKQVFSLGGGLLLLFLGITFFVKKYKGKPEGEIKGQKHDWTYIIKAFMLNVFNPGVFIIWIGIIGKAATYKFTDQGYILYIAGAIGTVFLTDLLKAAFSNKLGKLLKPKVINILHKVLGVIFILASLMLIRDFALMYFYGIDPYSEMMNTKG